MAGNTRDETIKYQFEAKETGISDVGKSLDEVSQKSVEAGNFFEFFKKHLEEIVSIAAAVEVALKAIDFGKESLKNAEAVEVSLSRVKALAGGAAEAFAGMEEAVDKAAQAVNVTSQTSAAGLSALVENGVKAENAIAALVPTLQLAKIANIDVGTAAAEVARQLAAFNLPATDAQKVVDELTAASHGAAGGLAAMSGAAASLAPDAKTLNLSFTDTVSILGLLSSKGLDTEKSVRGLRTLFQELENPTSKLRGELLALGDGTNDFGTAITALTANTPRARDALLGINGPARTLVELLGQAGPGALAQFNAGLQQTQGLAAKTAAVLDDNLKGAATKFGNAIESIGEKLAKPVLEPFNKELTKLAGELNKFADSPDFKDIEKEVGDMARNAAEALDKFLHAIDWKNFTANGKSAIQELSADFATFAKSAEDVAGAINKTFAAVGTAYHGVVGTIDAAVGAAAEGTDKIIAATEGSAVAIAGLAGQGDKAKRALDNMRDAAQSLGDTALSDLDHHTTKLREDVDTLTGAQTEAAAATKKTGDTAEEAAPKVAVLTASLSDIGPAATSGGHALEDLSKRAAETAEALKTAFNTLHITSQAALEQTAADYLKAFDVIDKGSAQTAAGLADRRAAFEAYAKAALAASENLDIGAKEATRYQLESRASALDMLDALEKLEGQGARTGNAVAAGAQHAAAALHSAADAAKEAGDKTDHFSERGRDSLGQLASAIAATRSAFLSVSKAAAEAFDTKFLGDFQQAFDGTGVGFTKVIHGMEQAAKDLNVEIATQRTQLAGEINAINDLGTAANTSFGGFGRDAASASAHMAEMIERIQQGTYDAGLLGQQELGPLQAALDAARQRMDALKAATEQANQQLSDMNSQLQDEIDQQSGDLTSIENRRYQQQVKNIEDLASKADAAGKAQAQEDLRLAEQIHQKKLKDIADQAAAQAHANNPQPGGGGASPQPAGPTAPGGGGTGGGGGGVGLQPIHIHVDGQHQTTLYGNQHAAQILAAIIAERNNSI